MYNNKIWYATFGAPATGKTTLLQNIVSAYTDYHYSGSDEILIPGTLLYDYHHKIFDEKDYSYFFKFQMEVLPMRFWQSQDCVNNSFVDETIFDTLSYTKAEKRLKWIEEHEYDTFYRNYNTLMRFLIRPKALIYLKCNDIHLIFDRMEKRGRDIEKNFTYDYIEALMKSFDEVVDELKFLKINIIEVNIEDLNEQELFSKVTERLF